MMHATTKADPRMQEISHFLFFVRIVTLTTEKRPLAIF